MAKQIRFYNTSACYRILDSVNSIDTGVVISNRRELGLDKTLSMGGSMALVRKRENRGLSMIGMEQSKVSLRQQMEADCHVGVSVMRMRRLVFSNGDLMERDG